MSAISDNSSGFHRGDARRETRSGSEAGGVDNHFDLHRALWKREMTEMTGQRTVGKGGINWSVECSAVREANERRKRAEQRDSCGQLVGPSIEHRTSLIFSLNLAQRIERGILNPSLQSFEPDFFNRTSLEATANVYTFNGTPDWNLSQSDTPNHLTTLNP